MKSGKSWCILSVFLPFFLSSGVAYAQNDLDISEIEVIKHFDARLIETQKAQVLPRLPEADTSARKYEYQLSRINPEITYLPPQIRPLALRPEEQPKAYRGFLRAGFGVPNAILGDLSYLIVDDDPLQLTISGFHQSANHKKTYLQKLSESGGMLSGNYYVSPGLSVSGELGYEYHRVHFYGLEPGDNTSYGDERRNFKTFTSQIGIGNTDLIGGHFNYRATLDYYTHRDDLSAKEDGMKLRLQGERWIAGAHVAALDITADLSTLEDSEQEQTLDNLFLKPSFSYRKNTFSATGGVNVAINQKEFYFFPTVDISVQISGSRLIAFAEVDGGLYKNNFRALSDYNPFIHQRIDEIRNTEHHDYYAGLKGRIGKLEYHGKAGLSNVKNLALFEPDGFDYRKFQPLYEDGNIVRIEGVVTAEPISHLKVGASVAKMFYDLDVQEKPWHLPSLHTAVFSTFLSENKKLRIHGELAIENGVPYINDDGDTDRLKGMFDVSLQADYYIIENIGAFIQVNNLLGIKHQRWQNYPEYGVNGVAGILIRI